MWDLAWACPWGVPFQLDRLDILAPNYADNDSHRLMVAATLGDTAMIMSAARRTAAESDGTGRAFGRSFVDGLTTRRAGSSPTAAQATKLLREYAIGMRSSPDLSWLPFNYTYPFAPLAVIDSSIANVLHDGSFVGFDAAATAARGNIAIARGDFEMGIATLASIETSRAPMFVRLGAVRSAALGSWLGGVSVEAADAALARARGSLGNVTGLDGAELQWLDGVIGVAAGDSARVFRAAAAITDTGRVGQRLPSSLRALWRARQTRSVDGLIAWEDSAIATGTIFPTVAALHRLAIGRALTDIDPARAEHYLQWTDSWYTNGRAATVKFIIEPYNSYQRGLAFEAAGDRAHAKLQFERFIEMVDRPPPSIKPQLDDARARLARITGDTRR